MVLVGLELLNDVNLGFFFGLMLLREDAELLPLFFEVVLLELLRNFSSLFGEFLSKAIFNFNTYKVRLNCNSKLFLYRTDPQII